VCDLETSLMRSLGDVTPNKIAPPPANKLGGPQSWCGRSEGTKYLLLLPETETRFLSIHPKASALYRMSYITSKFPIRPRNNKNHPLIESA